MKISGFSFVRNGFLYDYPFLESIRSILPLCDEFVVAVGDSEDTTREAIESLHSSKIKIIPTVWDESLREGGRILANQTNVALENVTGDWAFYLQADEIVHESDLESIAEFLHHHYPDKRVEGILMPYIHFYGSYSYVGASRRWYRHEIRIVRTGIGVKSWGDAQGFRINGRKMHVQAAKAPIYHYGWVKSPSAQQAKQKTFNRYWHDDRWVQEHVGIGSEFNYSEGGRLEVFQGTHPAIMKNRVALQDWAFDYDVKKVNQPFKERVLHWFETLTGMRIGEYRNYKLL